MKSKYEEFLLISLFIIVVFFLELVLVFYLFKIRINTYKVYDGVVLKDNLVQVLIKENDLKLFNGNKYLFYNNKKVSYSIEKVERNIIDNYHYVIINCNSYKKLTNEVFKFSLFDKKISLNNIFKIIWEGD